MLTKACMAGRFDGGGVSRGYYEKFTANLVKYLGLQSSQMFTYQVGLASTVLPTTFKASTCAHGILQWASVEQ